MVMAPDIIERWKASA